MATNFPGSLDSYTTWEDANPAHPITSAIPNNIQDAIVALQTKIGAGSYDFTLADALHNFIFSGQVLWFYENVALTGWSISAPSDTILACSGGSGAYAAAPGNVAGTAWTTLVAHVHTIAHTHSVTNHNHTWYHPVAGAYGTSLIRNAAGAWASADGGGAQDSGKYGIVSVTNASTYIIEVSSGTYAHTNKNGVGTTGGVSTPNSGAQSGATNPRPPAAVGIIASKD